MRTMYIACNNCFARGYFLGDVMGIIKVAWLFVRNEPHDRYVLSLHENEPLNFLWDRFVRLNRVEVIIDHWEKGDRDLQYAHFQRRLAERHVNGLRFDTYKEFYTRLDGGPRQNFLCGSERGLAGRNIFEYFYLGQRECNAEPAESNELGRGVIDIPHRPWETRRSVFIAPHEQAEGNRTFTHNFWSDVVKGLLAADVEVIVNDNCTPFMAGFSHPRFIRRFPSLGELPAVIRAQTLVVCGNTGIGWVAGACETPLVAAEQNLALAEYSFVKSGLRSLRAIIDEPSAPLATQIILRELSKLT